MIYFFYIYVFSTLLFCLLGPYSYFDLKVKLGLAKYPDPPKSKPEPIVEEGTIRFRPAMYISSFSKYEIYKNGKWQKAEDLNLLERLQAQADWF